MLRNEKMQEKILKNEWGYTKLTVADTFFKMLAIATVVVSVCVLANNRDTDSEKIKQEFTNISSDIEKVYLLRKNYYGVNEKILADANPEKYKLEAGKIKSEAGADISIKAVNFNGYRDSFVVQYEKLPEEMCNYIVNNSLPDDLPIAKTTINNKLIDIKKTPKVDDEYVCNDENTLIITSVPKNSRKSI